MLLVARYKPNTTQLDRMEGYEGMILQTLSEKLNFSFELIECEMKWGMRHEDGSWDGIIGAVYQGVIKLVVYYQVNILILLES